MIPDPIAQARAGAGNVRPQLTLELIKITGLTPIYAQEVPDHLRPARGGEQPVMWHLPTGTGLVVDDLEAVAARRARAAREAGWKKITGWLGRNRPKGMID